MWWEREQYMNTKAAWTLLPIAGRCQARHHRSQHSGLICLTFFETPWLLHSTQYKTRRPDLPCSRLNATCVRSHTYSVQFEVSLCVVSFTFWKRRVDHFLTPQKPQMKFKISRNNTKKGKQKLSATRHHCFQNVTVTSVQLASLEVSWCSADSCPDDNMNVCHQRLYIIWIQADNEHQGRTLFNTPSWATYDTSQAN